MKRARAHARSGALWNCSKWVADDVRAGMAGLLEQPAAAAGLIADLEAVRSRARSAVPPRWWEITCALRGRSESHNGAGPDHRLPAHDRGADRLNRLAVRARVPV